MEQTKQYLEFMQYGRNLSKNTIKSIENDFAQYGDNLENAERKDIELFVMNQNKQGLSTATIARRIASVKGFFEWQIYNGHRKGLNPASGKIAPKINNKSHTAITKEQLNSLYMNASSDTLKVAIALTGYAGMRIGEVVGFGSRNILYKDKNDNYAVRLTETKGDKERDVTLALVPDIELVKQVYNQGGLMGTRGILSENGLWRQMSNYFKDMGYQDFSPHGLRATFATLTVEMGTRVDIVRDLLGHSTLGGNAITSRYVSTSTVEEQYQELMEKGA